MQPQTEIHYTTCQKITRRYRTTIDTPDGTYKMLQVVKEREGQKPLVTHFGGVCLKWNKWVALDDNRQSLIWNGCSEVVQRLQAQECELCGSKEQIEVHHICKLADLEGGGWKSANTGNSLAAYPTSCTVL